MRKKMYWMSRSPGLFKHNRTISGPCFLSKRRVVNSLPSPSQAHFLLLHPRFDNSLKAKQDKIASLSTARENVPVINPRGSLQIVIPSFSYQHSLGKLPVIQ